MKENIKSIVKGCIAIAVLLFCLSLLISKNEISESYRSGDYLSLMSLVFEHIGNAVAVTMILSWAFVKYIWKWPVISKFHNVPILASKYVGTLHSSYKDTSHSCTLTIKQTFLSVSVKIKTEESYSGSITADILDLNGIKHLVYSYHNTPNANLQKKSQIHYGMAFLDISEPRVIEGNYYTSRDTKGNIKVESTE